MNSDIESLLAALQGMLSRGSFDSRATDTPANPMARQIGGGAPMGNNTINPTGQGGRAMTEAERRARGIDPRDPNIYQVGPNGQLIGTLIGWAGMGDKLTPEQLDRMWNERGGTGGAATPSKPNEYGMTRVSPGVYKDSSGRLVRSATGAPAPGQIASNRITRGMPKGGTGATPTNRENRGSAMGEANLAGTTPPRIPRTGGNKKGK